MKKEETHVPTFFFYCLMRLHFAWKLIKRVMYSTAAHIHTVNELKSSANPSALCLLLKHIIYAHVHTHMVYIMYM